MVDNNRAMTDREEARGRTERRRGKRQREGMESRDGLIGIQRSVNRRRARRGYLLTVVRGNRKRNRKRNRKWTGECSGPARSGYGREMRPTREAVRGARDTSAARF